jgi:hypothetical protein
MKMLIFIQSVQMSRVHSPYQLWTTQNIHDRHFTITNTRESTSTVACLACALATLTGPSLAEVGPGSGRGYKESDQYVLKECCSIFEGP